MALTIVEVKPGDTMWSLAEQHLTGPEFEGQSMHDKVKTLFWVNYPFIVDDIEDSDKIGPHWIFPGQELVVPEGVLFEPSGNP